MELLLLLLLHPELLLLLHLLQLVLMMELLLLQKELLLLRRHMKLRGRPELSRPSVVENMERVRVLAVRHGMAMGLGLRERVLHVRRVLARLVQLQPVRKGRVLHLCGLVLVRRPLQVAALTAHVHAGV